MTGDGRSTTGRPWSEVRRDMEEAGLARPRSVPVAEPFADCSEAMNHWRIEVTPVGGIPRYECSYCGEPMTTPARTASPTETPGGAP